MNLQKQIGKSIKIQDRKPENRVVDRLSLTDVARSIQGPSGHGSRFDVLGAIHVLRFVAMVSGGRFEVSLGLDVGRVRVTEWLLVLKNRDLGRLNGRGHGNGDRGSGGNILRLDGVSVSVLVLETRVRERSAVCIPVVLAFDVVVGISVRLGFLITRRQRLNVAEITQILKKEVISSHHFFLLRCSVEVATLVNSQQHLLQLDVRRSSNFLLLSIEKLEPQFSGRSQRNLRKTNTVVYLKYYLRGKINTHKSQDTYVELLVTA
jgi:hypothetical protein